MLLFSGMAGAVSMLQVLGDERMRDQMLRVTRGLYLRLRTAVI